MNIKELIRRNHDWAERVTRDNPDFFPTLAAQQTPEILWIGCADSRVPANQVLDLAPGEVFVHRNVSNLIVHSDLNMLSTVQFAVEVLKVKHIIICGHYGCGGVTAALSDDHLGLIDHWLLAIKDICAHNKDELDAIDNHAAKVDRACELNVIQQVENLCHASIIQKAWSKGQSLAVHGICYGLKDGKVKDMDVTVDSISKLAEIYRYRL